MRIAIIGAGSVGRTLGKVWASKGHTIHFGVRNPKDHKHDDLLDSLDAPGYLDTVGCAAETADVILLASPWPAVPEVIAACGDIGGKILIDCTNPLNPDLKSLSIGHTTSAGEEIARWAPHAHIVKCFNTIGAEMMAKPILHGMPITMPYCGHDKASTRIVAGLVEDIGFEPIDIGGLELSRLLEPLAMVWIYMAIHGVMKRDFALQILR